MSSATSTIKHIPDPRADIIIRPDDGPDFATRRKYLDAGSDVFESMLESSTDAQSDRDAKTGLPVVRITEVSAVVLDVILRLLARDQEKPDVSGMDAKQVASLWDFADKFGLDLIRELVVARLTALAPTQTLEVLGLALIHRHLSLARATMRHMQQTLMVIGPDHATSDLYKLKGLRCKWVVCGYGLRVANLPDEVWESVPGKVMKRLLQLKTKIMEGWVWAAVADEFTFDD